MKLFNLVVLVLAVLAMLMGSTSANPKDTAGALKKGAKAIKTGIGIVGTIGTAKEIYDNVKNKKG